MPYLFRIRKKKYVKDGDTHQKYFAVAKTKGTLCLEEIAQIISEKNIAKQEAVIGVLNEFAELMGDKLCDGYNIKLEGIGTFGVAITSEGFDTQTRIDTNKIKFSKLTFRSDSKLVKKLKEIKFSQEPQKQKGFVLVENTKNLSMVNNDRIPIKLKKRN